MKAAIAVALLVAACSSGATDIDGYHLGQATDCSGIACQQAEAVARDAYHPDQPIESMAMYLERDSQNRSGTLYIAVFTLADRSQHAVGVHCGISGCNEF